MACDICGKIGTELEPLNDSYTTEEFAQICGECRTVLNINLDKIRIATARIHKGWMKRAMQHMKDKFS